MNCGISHWNRFSSAVYAKQTNHGLGLVRPEPCILFNVISLKDSDAQLTPSDLQAWEEEHGKIPDDVILLVFTNWGRFWPDRKTYLGTDTKNTSLLHFPGMAFNHYDTLDGAMSFSSQ